MQTYMQENSLIKDPLVLSVQWTRSQRKTLQSESLISSGKSWDPEWLRGCEPAKERTIRRSTLNFKERFQENKWSMALPSAWSKEK